MAETGTDVEKAAWLLQQGKLVAIPTETVYGLAANALNPIAVAGIFKAKNRPFFDPLIVHLHDSNQVNSYASSFPPIAQKLANAFWPGPLTLVLPKSGIIPDLVTAGQPTVGLRMPAHELTRKLLALLPFPLAAPSANPFGYVSPTTATHVNDQLGDVVDYILDGGPCKVGLESSIVGFSESGKARILRLGGLTTESIAAVAGELDESLNQNSNPSAPGQLDQHYSPGCRLLPAPENLQELISNQDAKTALLRFSGTLPGFPENQQLVLSTDGSMESAASRLFQLLRQLDEQEYNVAYIEKVPDTGLGRAINDRLRRAMARNAD